MKAWWTRNEISIDLAIFTLIVLCLIGLAIMAALLPLKAHAGGCLSIEVPPQAVIGQPDGDTFHIFTFAPGGMVKIRVKGVDTPERDQPKFSAATTFTRTWLSRGPFKVMTCGTPTFDRVEAIVERDGQTLAHALIAAGLGKE